MTEAEVKRLRQRRTWDSEHLRTVGTKLSPDELQRLDAYCARIRMSRYGLLHCLILEELAASAIGSPPSFVENSVDNTPVKGCASGRSGHP